MVSLNSRPVAEEVLVKAVPTRRYFYAVSARPSIIFIQRRPSLEPGGNRGKPLFTAELFSIPLPLPLTVFFLNQNRYRYRDYRQVQGWAVFE